MCDTCGCNVTPGNRHLAEEGHAVEVLQGLLHANDHQARHNRGHLDRAGTLALNLMSSPGAGKTTLLEATIEALAGELSVAVIEGDLETENDARRIRAKGVPAVQIATGSACHLDAHMVHSALHDLELAGVDILFIENVGNLVCPASFDLGHHRNITLLSIPEGDDKPAKYPVMFRGTDLLLLTKSELLAVLDDFDAGRAEGYLRQLASRAPVMPVSARRGAGMDDWLAWLRAEVAEHRQRVARGDTLRPALQPDGMALHGHTTSQQGHHEQEASV